MGHPALRPTLPRLQAGPLLSSRLSLKASGIHPSFLSCSSFSHPSFLGILPGRLGRGGNSKGEHGQCRLQPWAEQRWAGGFLTQEKVLEISPRGILGNAWHFPEDVPGGKDGGSQRQLSVQCSRTLGLKVILASDFPEFRSLCVLLISLSLRRQERPPCGVCENSGSFEFP